jgi:nitrite reductase/ring-hydroxylating ferredoxin subunit
MMLSDSEGRRGEISMHDIPVVGAWAAKLCRAGDLPVEGLAAAFEASGRRIGVFCVDGIHYAVDDYCSHAGSSLSEDGKLICGHVVECALHRARFDLKTGAVLCGPTRKALRSYALRIEGGEVIAIQMTSKSGQRGDPPGKPADQREGAHDG